MRTTIMAIIVLLLFRIFVILSSLAIIDAPTSESGIGFIFGTASSTYQNEGAENVGGRGLTIWDNSTHKYPDLLRHYNEDVFTFNTSFVLWIGHGGISGFPLTSAVGDTEISSSLYSANALWRLVGLVSSVVGLLCYALSPSFNRLIGRWNILKFSLYGVFSLAIFTTILFVKQFSPSTRYAHIKTYTSFVVLMIISVYSFYYDKALNGKPEILSVVSNAAFALMSLSLSKLIRFGFEIGIFAYFLGCLVVQLWTINWMLILVAVIFGCPLFVIHSSSDSQENFDNRNQIIDESSGSDPEIGNAGQPDVGSGSDPDVGNESQVIVDSNQDSQQEVSSESQVIHCSVTIPKVASSGSDQHVDIILETNSIRVVAL